MWSTIYYIQFKDDNQGFWRVEIQSQDVQAAPVELQPAGDPLEWMNNGSESQTENIIGGSGTLRLTITDSTIQHFRTGGVLPASVTDRRVSVTRGGTLIWVGYIQMKTFSQDWEAAPVDVELPLIDTVGVLESLFVDKDETANATMDLLRHAHALAYGITEEEQPEDWIMTNHPRYINRWGLSDGGWANAEVFNGFFVSADGKDRMSYADALGVILSPYGRLVQVAGRWAVLDSRVTQSEIYCPREKTSSDWRQEGYMDIVDISRAIANTENTRSILAAPAKTTYSYSPEESKQKYDGDVIYEFGRKNIKSYYSIKPPVDVEWDKDGIHHRVRYMRIGENNLDQPISVETHQMQTTWTALDEGHVRYLLLPVYAPGRVQENRQWAQPCENVNNQGWKALKDQTYMFDRYLLLDGGLMFTIIEDIVTMKLHKEVSTSNEYILKIEREIKSADMLDDADFSDVAYRYTYFLQPFMQIYWSPVPWGEGVVPQKVFRFPLFLPNPEAKPEWTDCDGFFFPTFCTDSSMIPSFAFTSGGLRLFLPENRGYIAIRMYGSGWPIPGDLSIGPGYKARINNAGPFILSDLSISNDSWIGTTPTRLLEWNTENDTSKQFTYDNGAGDISLQFKTLAGDAPTSATFLTPRRGFDDSMRAVTSPREMIDIGAVQVTENGGIPGITRFSLFEFDSKTYFPVAIGMNARDNTVALKLIRTL